MKMFFKLAWRNLWRNRKRTIITMASIVFAVVLAVLINSLKDGVLHKMRENVVSFYTGEVQVHQAGYWDEQTIDNSFAHDDDLFQKITKHPNVSQVIERLESFALAASDENSRGCLVVGINLQMESEVTNLDKKLVRGEYLNDRGVLVAEGLADYLKLDVGDTLVLIGSGYRGVSAAGKYAIQGMVHFPSQELNKSLVYLPIEEAQRLYGAENRYTALVLKLNDINKSAQTAEDLQNEVDVNSYEVMNWQMLLPELDQMIKAENMENTIFLLILYLLISFGIFGTVLMMTLERQYEFGVLIAIGMRKLKLSSVVVLENMMIAFTGSLVGMILSFPVVGYFHYSPISLRGELKEVYEKFGFEPIIYFSLHPSIFYYQTLLVLVIALVLSVYPMFRIAAIDPVKAMRE